MSKTLNLNGNLQIYDATTPTNSPQDAMLVPLSIQQDEISQDSRQQLQLPANSGSYTTISLPTTTCTYCEIFSDQPINLKLNSGSQVLALAPRVAGLKTFVFHFRGTITGVALECPGAEVANVDIILAAN